MCNTRRSGHPSKNHPWQHLCVGVLSVLTDILWRSSVTWKAGNTACKVVRYSQAVVTYSSTYVLVALSIDRYYAIKYPMNFCGS
ncbi:hypothetical protein WDU94_000040, partial [Cyamophila willieti]